MKKPCLRTFDVDRVLEELEFVLENIYVEFGQRLYRQRLGVPMGFSSSPMMAVLMLAAYELQLSNNGGKKWGAPVRADLASVKEVGEGQLSFECSDGCTRSLQLE